MRFYTTFGSARIDASSPIDRSAQRNTESPLENKRNGLETAAYRDGQPEKPAFFGNGLELSDALP